VNGGPPELIAAVDERLRTAGAEKVPQIPKLSRALGRGATLPWQLAAPQLGSKPTLAQAAHAQLMTGVARLVDLHALVVLDADGSAERARDAAGELLTALDAFSSLFEPALPASLAPALAAVESELAAVAELDALRERLKQPATQAALGRAGARSLDDRLAAARTRARGRLLRALRGRPYTTALHALARTAVSAPSPSTLGSRRVGSAGKKFVRSAWRAVRDQNGAQPPAVGRLRWALQLTSAVSGAEAAAALEHVDRLAAAARERDEALALAARLRALSARGTPAEAWAAGVIAGGQHASAEAAAREYGREWDALAAKGAWSWTD
jgi:hypothetical protein